MSSKILRLECPLIVGNDGNSTIQRPKLNLPKKKASNGSLNTPNYDDDEPIDDNIFNRQFEQITMNEEAPNFPQPQPFETTWGIKSFNDEPCNDEDIADFDMCTDADMTCVNPLEAEGRPDLRPLHTDDMPLLDEPEVLTTPENMMNDTEFDLLEFVTNSAIPLDDPSFRSFIDEGTKVEPVDPTTTWNIPVGDKVVTMVELPVVNNTIDDVQLPGPGKKLMPSTIDLEAFKSEAEDPDYVPVERPPTKRGPGRPRVPRTTPLSVERSIGKRARGRPLGSTGTRRPSCTVTSAAINDHAYNVASTSGVFVEDLKDAKYRRMRDLNNIASKRCRLKRRNKMDDMVETEDQLRDRNKNLRIKCRQMEELVSRLKEKFLTKVANPPQQQPVTVVIPEQPVIVVPETSSTINFDDIYNGLVHNM